MGTGCVRVVWKNIFVECWYCVHYQRGNTSGIARVQTRAFDVDIQSERNEERSGYFRLVSSTLTIVESAGPWHKSRHPVCSGNAKILAEHAGQLDGVFLSFN